MLYKSLQLRAETSSVSPFGLGRSLGASEGTRGRRSRHRHHRRRLRLRLRRRSSGSIVRAHRKRT